MRRFLAAVVSLAVLVSCEKEDPVILVQSISFDQTELKIKEGQTQYVTATVAPPDATDKSLTWSSSDPAVASVTNGNIKALSIGKATITATANDGSGRKASCNVTVKHSGAAITFDSGQDKNMVAGTEGGSFTLSFTALESWTASLVNTRADSWVELSPTSGDKGKAEIRVKVAENSSFDGRSASIIITCDDESETVTVTQKQKDALTLSTDRFEMDSKGGSISVALKSNVNFTYRISEDSKAWIQAVETKSYDDYTCTFSIAENEDLTGREGQIVFTDGNLSETVHVFQEGALPTIIISEHYYDLGSEGGQVRIDVRSNVGVTMTIPDYATWIREIETKAYSTNVFYLLVEPNASPDDRSASISFTNSENGLSEKVFITQKQLDMINVADGVIIVPEAGGRFDITLESNVGYTVSTDADWLKEITTKSLESYTHSFAAQPLPADMFSREAFISIIDNTGNNSKVVSVLQQEGSPVIQFKDENVKAICVEKWDRTGDGELSQREAAAVTGLGRAFSQNAAITSFDELVYFTGLSEIDGSAFRECPALESITIPENVLTVGYAAFYGCDALEAITLPESLEHIGGWAFGYCRALKTITIPANVTEIGEYAFAYSYALRRIECLPADPPKCGAYFLAGTKDGWIVVPEGSVQKYKEADGWKDYPERIISSKEEDSPAIQFKDGNVKAICVERWDRNGDGELSEREAAAVTGLDWAFTRNEAITSFDELAYFTGLSEIHDSAFSGCTVLESITIPENVLTVGYTAFYLCDALKSVILPESLTLVKGWAFAYCPSLKEIALPANVTELGEYAFAYSGALRRIECLPVNPPKCGERFLAGTKDGWIVVPEGCVQKYKEADGWKDYPERIITAKEEDSPAIQFKDGNVKAICVEKWDRNGDGVLSEREAAAVTGLDWAFYENDAITSFDELAYFTGLSEIHASAFMRCTALESITVPENVLTVGYTAFYQCDALKSVTLPESLEFIDGWAFSSCPSLTSITIPANVTELGRYIFAYSSALRIIECLPVNPPKCGERFLAGTKDGWIVVPEGSVQKYLDADSWKDYPDRIVTKKELASPNITFKDEDTKAACIERWDRDGDGELSEREAASVTEIYHEEVFRHLRSFDELEYFTGLTRLNSYLFHDNSNLVSVKLPPNLKTIEEYALSYTGLQCELNLPDGLVSIENHAFAGSSGLTGSLVLPNSLTSLGYGAFYNCSGFTGSLTLPESLTSMGGYAFAFCSGLTGDLTIPSSITEVPVEAFYDCSGMDGTLTLHKDIKSLGRLSFYNTSFSRINVLSIDPPAFEERAFNNKGCYIYVPSGRASLYQLTDGWKSVCLRITEEGHQPKEFFYRSTDYSADGEVVCLQRATKGKGINLIFLGDGFVDKDMGPGGKYEENMRRWMEQFFVYEPYTTFREWFNIYTVKVVSPNSIFGTPDSERRLTRDLGEQDEGGLFGNSLVSEVDVCTEYAELVPNPHNQGLKVAVFMNTDTSVGRSYCGYGTNGYCMAFVFDCIDRRPSTLNHEIGGHGFAWLADEYIEFDQTYPNAQASIENYHRRGTDMNVDWRSDPSTVVWSRFLQDPRYANEGLGVFEGACRYYYGVYRPTENSMMRHDYAKGAVFNAPSREAIYKNIMRWGAEDDWEYDYETFVKIDEAGRRQAAEAYATYPPAAPFSLSDKEEFEMGLPPVQIDNTVKKIIVSSDGKMTILH